MNIPRPEPWRTPTAEDFEREAEASFQRSAREVAALAARPWPKPTHTGPSSDPQAIAEAEARAAAFRQFSLNPPGPVAPPAPWDAGTYLRDGLDLAAGLRKGQAADLDQQFLRQRANLLPSALRYDQALKEAETAKLKAQTAQAQDVSDGPVPHFTDFLDADLFNSDPAPAQAPTRLAPPAPSLYPAPDFTFRPLTLGDVAPIGSGPVFGLPSASNPTPAAVEANDPVPKLLPPLPPLGLTTVA